MDIKRLRDRDSQGELLSFSVFSSSLPQHLAHEVDALCVFTGQGEDIRIAQPAKKYWEAVGSKNRFFLVPGHHRAERYWKDMTLEALAKKPFNLGRLDGVVVTPPLVTTKDQAQWIAKEVQDRGITSLGVVSSPFHLLRAYLTMLAAMKAVGVRIPVIPVPVDVAPAALIPEQGVGAWEVIQGEAERIAAYQKKGDVVSYESFKEYIDWLWQQPLLKNV